MPDFNYKVAWSIAPKKRRVVVEVYKGERSGELVCYEQGGKGADTIQRAGLHKLLGTIEGEVKV